MPIHPTAIVSPKAELDPTVEVGPHVIIDEHVKNNAKVRRLLVDRGIVPENLPPAEDVKKVERRLASEQKKLSRPAK